MTCQTLQAEVYWEVDTESASGNGPGVWCSVWINLWSHVLAHKETDLATELILQQTTGHPWPHASTVVLNA